MNSKLNEVHYVNMSISKREEQETFEFIKRRIIPKVVMEEKNYDPPITPEEVIENLKKTNHFKKGSLPVTRYADVIEYTSIIRQGTVEPFDDGVKYPTLVKLKFYISKQVKELNDTYKDFLVVGYQNPHAASDWSRITWWFVDYSKPIYENTTTPFGKLLKEEVEEKSKEQFSISKMEEQRALTFMRNVVIPSLVRDWNEEATKKESPLFGYKPLKKINVAEVSNNLRKTKHYKYGDKEGIPKTYTSDYIVYTSTVPAVYSSNILKNQIFTFFIDKGYNPQVKDYTTHVGYEDPFVLRSHSFRVGGHYL